MKQKHLICTENWSVDELINIIDTAKKMKEQHDIMQVSKHLAGKTFMLFSCNPSLRTLTSFESAVTQLGGIPVYRTPEMMWLSNDAQYQGEAIKDIAQVVATYCCGIGLRILLNKVPYYGYGNQLLNEYSQWSSVPVISMADDRFHPCQGLADLMTWAESFNDDRSANLTSLKGKTLLVTWARSRLIRPWSSVQSHLLLGSRFGMNVVVARPNGYDLDPEVYSKVSEHCRQHNTSFRITNEPDTGYDDAHVVFARNWISHDAYQNNQLQTELELEKSLSYPNWITTQERMERTANAIFANPMPIDRDYEAEEAVIDGKRSVIYKVVENRLYIEKAILYHLIP